MFLESTIFSVLIAKLRGGSFRRLADVDIRGYGFLFLSLFIQMSMSILKMIDSRFSNGFLQNYSFYIYLLSYIFIIIAISLNVSKNSMKIFLFGVVLNAIVIFLNSGKMPVDIEKIKGVTSNEIVISEFDIKHSFMDENTKMHYLGDIILIPPPYPMPRMISLGDIFLMGGIVVFFQEAMVRKKTRRDPVKMIKTVR